MSRLKLEQLHLMRLIVKGADEYGWAKVSKTVRPFMDNLPKELVVLVDSDEGCKAQLTHDGSVVLKWT